MTLVLTRRFGEAKHVLARFGTKFCLHFAYTPAIRLLFHACARAKNCLGVAFKEGNSSTQKLASCSPERSASVTMTSFDFPVLHDSTAVDC
jgi:hypothetical protein